MDWMHLAIGVALGLPASLLHFAGLHLGVRMVSNGARAVPVLLISAAVRIALLLLTGWVAIGVGLWSGIGYALAFLATRWSVIAWSRRSLMEEERP